MGSWAACKIDARVVRTAVFVVEQSIPIELEWDEWDETSLHAVAVNPAGEAVGTGRLLPASFDSGSPATGHIGRMAVIASMRRHGVGSAILRAVMQAASKQSFADVVLHAQSYVVPFYARHGFVIEGDEFVEAGIAHRIMRAHL